MKYCNLKTGLGNCPMLGTSIAVLYGGKNAIIKGNKGDPSCKTVNCKIAAMEQIVHNTIRHYLFTSQSIQATISNNISILNFKQIIFAVTWIKHATRCSWRNNIAIIDTISCYAAQKYVENRIDLVFAFDAFWYCKKENRIESDQGALKKQRNETKCLRSNAIFQPWMS